MSGSLVDVGSGNGCPGIPLLVGRHLRAAHLVEARVKRAAFLRHVAARLGAENIIVHKERLEDMTAAPDVDWVTLQGVRPTATLIEALRRLFSSTTRVVWVTSVDSVMTPGTTIEVPESNTVAEVFELDQF